jgi:exopolysaccharide/PEP-CTERM locus tyrosine autokinase
MSLIEQAAKRLEELRRAGVDVPEVVPKPRQVPVAMAGAVEAANARSPSAPADPSRKSVSGIATAKPAAPPPAEQMAEDSTKVHLDLEHLARKGIVTPDAPRSNIADEFRVIKRPLLMNATGRGAAPIRNGNLIMVTSALPGEGKSFTAVNLAMSIATELDHTVLLVDADVARPTIPSLLALPATRGLLDILVDKSVELSQVLLKTDVKKLSVLLSGTKHPRATELLASEAMGHLLDDLASRYSDRIIIFDSPPLLVTTEARELASHAGQVVVVVEALSTGHAAVKQALATIDACPVKMLMLNKGRSASGGGGYGYGYGYGYGS